MNSIRQRGGKAGEEEKKKKWMICTVSKVEFCYIGRNETNGTSQGKS